MRDKCEEKCGGTGRKMLVEDWINSLHKCRKVRSDGCKHRKVTPGLEVSF